MGLFLAALLGVLMASRQRRKLGVHALGGAVFMALVVAVLAALGHEALDWGKGLQLVMAVSGGLSSYLVGALAGVGETIEGGAGSWLSSFVNKFMGGKK